MEAGILPPWERRDPITAARMNAMQDAIPRVIGGRGIIVHRSSEGTTVSLADELPRPKQAFYARITGNQQHAPGQWLYGWEEWHKTGAGYSGWVKRPEGRSGTTDDRPARNYAEIMNDGSGVEGHGINVDNLPGDFATVPCPTGQIVLMTLVLLHDGEGTKEHWFHFAGAVDGSCE